MNRFIFALCVLLGWLFLSSFTAHNDTIKLYKPHEVIEFDTIPYMVDDPYFMEAYNEIKGMLEGKGGLSFKRSMFLVEWAYMSGDMDYDKFCADIDSVVSTLKNFIKINNLEQYKTSGNFALFEYFTKPNPLNNYKPFRYDFEDFIGQDFRKLTVTKVMQTHTGQCTSLPIYYKILSDELGAESFLALAPNHMYIKHMAENGRWVNIELTNGHFSTDAWMISSMDISAEAIKNNVYLNALNEKESIAVILCNLSIAYQRKYGYDYFNLKCADTVLEYFPNCLQGLGIRENAYALLGNKYVEKYGRVPSMFIYNNYLNFKKAKDEIDSLGYNELTAGNYEKWLKSMDEEIAKQQLENKK